MSGLHVAIIMDGNGRWARSRGLPRWRGHLGGVESVRDAVKASPDLGISTLTLYAFSQDNWKRPAAEVGRLFWLLREYCARERDELVREGVRVTTVGWRHRIPSSALKQLEMTEAATAKNTRLHLRLAIDYSSRTALTEAALRLAAKVERGEVKRDAVTRDDLEDVLSDAPMVDLLVRTAGEQRVSDFLLWEIAYAELYFTDALWPDFRRADLQAAMAEFRRRERRFGGLIAVPGGETPSPAPQLVPAAAARRRA